MSLPPERILNAAAVMLVRQHGRRELYWVQRSREVSLGGGCFAFPGGRVDAADATLAGKLGAGDMDGTLRITALRELFEETGVLLAAGSPAREALAVERKALLGEERGFEEVLRRLGVTLQPERLAPAGRWLTPPFIRTRFDTRFFAVEARGEAPEVWPGELARGEWITPDDALARWRAGRALLHPPAVHLIESLQLQPIPASLPRMNAPPHLIDLVAQRIEFQAGVLVVPLRTPTLPPATHTNCYIVGEQEVVVIDPGSPYPEEQERLESVVDSLRAEGRRFLSILITHHHHDHVSGVNRLREKLGIPVRAHPKAAELLAPDVRVDETIAPDDRIVLPGPLGLKLRALFTPGHTPGHLCFLEETSGALFAGDMVAGIGTIVVNPPEGDMSDYVASLHRLRSLPVSAIYPAHGPTIPDGPAKLDEYMAHRAEREAQIVSALRKAGPATAEALVPHVYTDVDPAMYPLAARSLTAVLDKLTKEGRVEVVDAERFRLNS